MTNTLKSCPFCGGEARLKSSHGFNNVSCRNCGMEYPVSFDTRKKAAAVWNKRSIEDKKDKEIKRLREDFKRYEDALFKICFWCAATDCSSELQSEALKAIDAICKEFYLSPENGVAKPVGERQENDRLREALNEIKKTVEGAQDTIYPFHITLDGKDAVYILEVTKKALKGDDK